MDYFFQDEFSMHCVYDRGDLLFPIEIHISSVIYIRPFCLDDLTVFTFGSFDLYVVGIVL